MPLMSIVMSDPVPPGAPLLLAPRLIDAFGFRLAALEVENGEIIGEIKALNGGQTGYLIRPTAQPLRPVLRYFLEAFDGEPPDWIWSPEANPTAPASEALAAFARRLTSGAATETEAARRIIDHVGDVFWYGHGPDAVMDGKDSAPLITVPTRGHCVDMHVYAIAACRSVGVTAAYCAGFWFREGTDRAPGMHCWFATRTDGATTPYDVSHQLMIPARPIIAGLNPVAGLRVLAAAGKGLEFDTPLGRTKVSHFARPVWRTEDGRDHYPAHEIRLEAAPGATSSAIRHEPAC